jgi:hypothetical protein
VTTLIETAFDQTLRSDVTAPIRDGLLIEDNGHVDRIDIQSLQDDAGFYLPREVSVIRRLDSTVTVNAGTPAGTGTRFGGRAGILGFDRRGRSEAASDRGGSGWRSSVRDRSRREFADRSSGQRPERFPDAGAEAAQLRLSADGTEIAMQATAADGAVFQGILPMANAVRVPHLGTDGDARLVRICGGVEALGMSAVLSMDTNEAEAFAFFPDLPGSRHVETLGESESTPTAVEAFRQRAAPVDWLLGQEAEAELWSDQAESEEGGAWQEPREADFGAVDGVLADDSWIEPASPDCPAGRLPTESHRSPRA